MRYGGGYNNRHAQKLYSWYVVSIDNRILIYRLCQWRVCYVFYGNDVRHYVMPSASNNKQFLLSNEIINFLYHSLYVYFFLNSLQHIFNIFSCLQTSILLSNQNSIGHSLIFHIPSCGEQYQLVTRDHDHAPLKLLIIRCIALAVA